MGVTRTVTYRPTQQPNVEIIACSRPVCYYYKKKPITHPDLATTKRTATHSTHTASKFFVVVPVWARAHVFVLGKQRIRAGYGKTSLTGLSWKVATGLLGECRMGVGYYIFFGFFSGLCGQIEVVRDAWGSFVRLLVWIKKQACTDFRGK